jgi:small subunit ribosomal protein S20
MREAIDAGKSEEAQSALRGTVSLIDRMSSKGVIHNNTAARYKSRLAKRLAVASAAE